MKTLTLVSPPTDGMMPLPALTHQFFVRTRTATRHGQHFDRVTTTARERVQADSAADDLPAEMTGEAA